MGQAIRLQWLLPHEWLLNIHQLSLAGIGMAPVSRDLLPNNGLSGSWMFIVDIRANRSLTEFRLVCRQSVSYEMVTSDTSESASESAVVVRWDEKVDPDQS